MNFNRVICKYISHIQFLNIYFIVNEKEIIYALRNSRKNHHHSVSSISKILFQVNS
jgi:hypothetical protein